MKDISQFILILDNLEKLHIGLLDLPQNKLISPIILFIKYFPIQSLFLLIELHNPFFHLFAFVTECHKLLVGNRPLLKLKTQFDALSCQILHFLLFVFQFMSHMLINNTLRAFIEVFNRF